MEFRMTTVKELTIALAQAQQALAQVQRDLAEAQRELAETQRDLAEARREPLLCDTAANQGTDGAPDRWPSVSGAVLDPLTRLHNRRGLYGRLEQEVLRAAQYRISLSVILLDLDRFQEYNEAHGKAAGDDVLLIVARMVQQNARDVDFVARFGDDAFIVLAPAGVRENSLIIAERLRMALKQADWPHGPVTASFGITTFLSPDRHPTPESLILEAQDALAVSQSAGGDRVTHAQS
jgi:diguanylate cyclase (GGDEF)-like protein